MKFATPMVSTKPAAPSASKPATPLAPLIGGWRAARENRKTLAYRALVFFTYMYFVRPEDFIPGLVYIPVARISGGIALLALMFGARAKDRNKLPLELKLLAVLLVHMLLTIVFASWPGGAFEMVVNRFSKGVIIAFLVYLAVDTIDELRKLLLIQAATIALVTLASILVHHTQDGRLMGIQKGILENPNDLAINIVISFPLCVAFLLGSRKMFGKVFWSANLVFMMYAVVATYSRSGLIAFAITGIICFWEFVVKGKRMGLLVGMTVLGVIGLVVVAATPSYTARVKSIFEGNVAGSKDKGSREARKQLILAAGRLTMQHPV